MPWPFVSVVDTPVIPVRFPLMVNCCAKVNRLPCCCEVGSLTMSRTVDRRWNRHLRSLQIGSGRRLERKAALVISRVLENPVTST